MVKMDLGDSNSQASSTATMTSSRVAAYTNLISSLGQLSSADGLSGATYDSAKAYASSVMVPIIQGGILLSEAISEALTKFPSDYSSQVAPESLDSEELQEQIDAYQKTYDSSLEWYNSAKNKKSVSASSLESAQRSMMGASAKIEELKEKKRKLEAFDGTSSSIFDAISELETSVTQGLSVATGSFNAYNGTFTVPSRSSQMEWAKTINTQWEAKVKDGSVAYYKVRAKIARSEELTEKDIKVILDYTSKHPLKSTDQSVVDALHKYAVANRISMKDIPQSMLINLNSSDIFDGTFGTIHTVEGSQEFIKDTTFWRSVYLKHTSNFETTEEGIIQGKFNNGTINGVKIDLKVISLDLDVKDWHININPEISMFGYQMNIKGDLGFDSDNGFPYPEVDLSFGYGEVDKWSQDWGMKVSGNVWDGMLGVYGKNSTIHTIDKNTKHTETTESGFRTINGVHGVAVVGVVAAVIFAPEIIPGLFALA